MTRNQNTPDEIGPHGSDDVPTLIEALGRPDALQIVRRAAENEALLERTVAAVKRTDVTPLRPQTPRPHVALSGEKSTKWYMWPIAAAVVLGVGLSLWPHGQKAPPAEVATTIETHSAQKADTRLPDGTRVVLAPSSKLLVSGSFKSGPRVVTLDGEAYFEVAHCPGRPFSVHAAGTTVEDIGTAFVVRAYATDRANAVAVRNGKVRVSDSVGSATPALDLAEGEAAQVDRTSRRLERVKLDPRTSFAWMDGTLVFERATVREVLAELGRWYDLDLRVADSTLLQQHLLFELRDNASVSDALATVSSLTSTKADRQGRDVTLRKGK